MQGVSLTYYYITNLQGDVMYLIDASKNTVASYDYDPYGKIIEVNDYSTQTYAQKPTEPEDTTKTLAELNPLRYRGYYYDNDDVGFYYLQSRYYDASTCRFISADEYTSTGQEIITYNMFAYCGNSPVNRNDETGEFWNILAGAVIGGVISAVSQVVTNVVTGNDWSEGVLEAGIAGAVSGGLAATGLGKAGQVIGNAIIGGVSEGINQFKAYKKDPQSFSWTKAIVSVGGAAGLGAVSGLIGGEGARAKGSDYRLALDNMKSVKTKVAGKIYSNLNTPKKLLYHAQKIVRASARSCTRTTSIRFFLGAKFSQYGMAGVKEILSS